VKIVGLKIDKGTISVSIIDKGLRQAELKDSFGLSYATDAELVDILRDKSRDWAGARIVTSIPGHLFSQRTVSFPFADRRRVEKALPFEIEDTVPYSLDDVALDHVVLEKNETGAEKNKETAVIGMMLPKMVLRQHLDLLLQAGVDPQIVMPSYIGLSSIAKMIQVEGVAVIADDYDICLKDGNRVRSCRSFSGSQTTGGVKHTLKALEAEHGVQIEKAYVLSNSSGLGTSLAEEGLAVEQVSPEFHGRKANDAISLGLALSDQVNFRKGEFTYQLADAGVRKRRNALIIAAALTALLAAANLGVKFYLVRSTYNMLDNEIKEIYRQTFPNARPAADPVRQLKISLDEAKKKFGVLGSGLSALDIMKAVTEGIPKEVRVNFQEFLLEGDRLKFAGEVASFESVDKMKAELQKSGSFDDVQVQDTRMGVDNKVKFRVEIKLKQAM